MLIQKLKACQVSKYAKSDLEKIKEYSQYTKEKEIIE